MRASSLLFFHNRLRALHRLFVIVCTRCPASKDHVTTKVTLGVNNRSQTLFCDGQERMRVLGRATGVHGNLNGPCSSILEANRARETRRKLTMNLTLRRTCSNSTPRDKVPNKLRREGIQELDTSWQPKLVHFQKEPSRLAKPFIDLKRPIKTWVINQSLPADSSTWLLKVHTHNNQDLIGNTLGKLCKFFCVFSTSINIMNGAGPDHNNHSIILLVYDRMNSLSACRHVLSSFLGSRHFIHQTRRRQQGRQKINPHIIDRLCKFL
mmetsp:Transcript_2453/g.4920  ORF Transcript_2453/g.4920 Transcript_2453/m.4920 type:complete len:266 (-) Transcript_2453:289-1086(-)